MAANLRRGWIRIGIVFAAIYWLVAALICWMTVDQKVYDMHNFFIPSVNEGTDVRYGIDPPDGRSGTIYAPNPEEAQKKAQQYGAENPFMTRGQVQRRAWAVGMGWSFGIFALIHAIVAWIAAGFLPPRVPEPKG